MSKYPSSFSPKVMLWAAETVVCFILLAFYSVAVHGALTVVPVDRLSFVGDPVKLYCSTNLTVANAIYWTRVNRSAMTRISNGTQTIMSRYSIDTSLSNSYNLVIDPTEITDAQYIYECRENVVSGQTARTNLSLLDATFTSNASNDGVMMGEYIVLDCYVSYVGYLAAIVNSSSNETQSVQNNYTAGLTGSSHEYTNVTVSQPVFGPYCCNVWCRAAETLIMKQLTVDSQQVLSPVRNVSVNTSHYSLLYVGHVIRCSAEGYPEPTYLWELQANDTHNWHNGSLMTLSIPGTFNVRCTVNNLIRNVTYNATSHDVQLTVLPAPASGASKRYVNWGNVWLIIGVVIILFTSTDDISCRSSS